MYILHSNITSLSALSLAFFVPFCFIILVRYSGNESRALVYRFYLNATAIMQTVTII